MRTQEDEDGIHRVPALDILRNDILATSEAIGYSRIRQIEDWKELGGRFDKYLDDLKQLQINQDDITIALNLVLNQLDSDETDPLPLKQAWSTLAARVTEGYACVLGRLLFYKSSGRLTGNGQIRPTSGWLGGVVLNTNGLNQATLTLYDSRRGSGKRLYRLTVASGDNQRGKFFGNKPIRFTIGCTRKVHGSGASCIIYYR